MKMQLACGCCTPLCYKKWMPRDEVVRHVRLSGQMLTIKNHPYEIADGMALPVDGLPTAALPLDGPADFAHGSGFGLGYFGISTGAHRMHLYLEYGDQALEAWEADQTLIDTPLGVGSDAGPFAEWQIPIDFNETQQPTCYKAANGGTIQHTNRSDFGGGIADVEIDHENLLYAGGPLLLTTVKYMHVKAIAYASSVGNLDWFPKTYAEIDATGHPELYTVFDMGLAVVYNATIGDTPANILSVPKSELQFEPGWVGDWGESYDQATDGESLHIQPDGGGGGGGWPTGGNWYSAYARPNIAPGETGWTNDAIVTGYRVDESVSYTPIGVFQDGDVFSAGEVNAYLHSSRDTKTIDREWISDTVGSAVYPIQGQPPIGFPNILSTTNNAGFYQWALHFDAEWNIGKLGKYEVTTPTDSLYTFFGTFGKTGDPAEWTHEDGEMYTYPTPVDLRPRPPLSTKGVGGSWTLPFYDGTRRYKYSFETYSPTTPPFGTPPPDEPSPVNVFSDNYGASVGQSILYKSDSAGSPWRKPEDFTELMEAYPSNTIAGDQSPGFGDVDGSIVAGAQPRTPPSFTICGESTTAEFTREETPEEE